MIRTFIKRACWAVAAFGVGVFALLMLNLVQSASWTGLAIILALPAFIIGGILRANDALRRQGYNDADIPTSRGNLIRSMVVGWSAGIALAIVAGLLIYFTRH